MHFVTKAKPAEVIGMIAEFLQQCRDGKPLVIVDTLGKARPTGPGALTPTSGITPSAANSRTQSTPCPAQPC